MKRATVWLYTKTTTFNIETTNDVPIHQIDIDWYRDEWSSSAEQPLQFYRIIITE